MTTTYVNGIDDELAALNSVLVSADEAIDAADDVRSVKRWQPTCPCREHPARKAPADGKDATANVGQVAAGPR